MCKVNKFKKGIYSVDELEYLKKHYADMPTQEIADYLGRHKDRIIGKANQMGLRKSEAFFKSGASGRMLFGSKLGEATRFTKQCPGWNKGKKRKDYVKNPLILAKMEATQFKKGNVPHNRKPIATNRIADNGYIEIKVGAFENHAENYQFKHRIVWEEANGKVPASYVVCFKDGDKMNCDLSNLELVHRSELLRKNSLTDSCIVKKNFRIKEPDLVNKIITEKQDLITLKRASLMLNEKINKRNEKATR
jgi:HNH endonuclease